MLWSHRGSAPCRDAPRLARVVREVLGRIPGAVILATVVLSALGVLTFAMQVMALAVGNVWFGALAVFLLRLPGPASSVPGVGPERSLRISPPIDRVPQPAQRP